MMSLDVIGFFIFALIFILIGAIGYLYFGRDYCIDKKTIMTFGDQNCRVYNCESRDINLLSQCLRKDNGDISLIVEAEKKTKILTYYVGVAGHLSKLRYLIVISETSSELDAIYGSEYIYQVAKYNKIYGTIVHGLIGVPSDIIYLPEFVEAIEVFNGRSYSFYRLPIFFGYSPLDRIVEMLKINYKSRSEKN